MFDIGFSELMVIAVVALVVIGPERLPKVARTLGHLMGRAQRYVNDVKTEINREMEIDELRKLQAQMQDAARDLENSMQNTIQSTESDVKGTIAKLEADIAEMEKSLDSPTVTQAPTAAPVEAADPPYATVEAGAFEDAPMPELLGGPEHFEPSPAPVVHTANAETTDQSPPAAPTEHRTPSA